MNFVKIAIDEIVRETENCVSLRFALPQDHPLRKFEPGQYLTMRYHFKGEEFLRCYSFSSLPDDPMVGITVKKTAHGFISKEIVDHLKPGMILELGEIHGKFRIPSSTDQRRSHYFFAAGSGITPVLSMIRHVLESEPMSTVVLLYSNKTADDIIFHEQLKMMSGHYAGQFHVFHTLTGSRKFLGLSLPSRPGPDWKGWSGRVDASMLAKMADELKDSNKVREHYLCGPGNFIQTVEKMLTESGIEPGRIHKEYFTVSDAASGQSQNLRRDELKEATLSFTLQGKTDSIRLKAGEKILDGLIREGFDPPHSCSSGACASCVARVINGSVRMDSDLALDKSEIEQGYVLTCQSRCVTPEVEIRYE